MNLNKIHDSVGKALLPFAINLTIFTFQNVTFFDAHLRKVYITRTERDVINKKT